MKSISLIVIYVFSGLLLLFGWNSVSAQEKVQDIEFSIKTDSQKENGKRVYSLIITMKSPNTFPYSVYLYDKEPWKNGTVLMKEEKTSTNSVVFAGVEPGKYCIIVLDSRETMKGKWYTVQP